MAPSVADIIRIIEIIAPLYRAEPWDNCGLQAGNPDAPVKKIAFALEADVQTIEAARAQGADLLVTHHPVIFPSIASIDVRSGAGKALSAALAAGISVYSAHTSLDHAPAGTSMALARSLSLVDPAPLPRPEPEGPTPGGGGAKPDGIVCIGGLSGPMKLSDLARFVRQSLEAPAVRITGDPQAPVSRAAVCAGSGGDFIAAARASGADVFITGEIRYHAALAAHDSGIPVIEAGHYQTELPAMFETARAVGQQACAGGWDVEVTVIRGHDPFTYV